MDKLIGPVKNKQFPVPSANGPYTGRKGAPVNFKASVEGGSEPYKFYWEFGDGGRSALQNVQHTYAASGNFIVSLRVVDGNGKSKLVYTSAIIESASVIVDLGSELTAEVWSPVQFRARLSGGGNPEFYTFTWNFGDGSPTREGPNRMTRTYNMPGEYMVSVTVSDDEGIVGSASVKVTVNAKLAALMENEPMKHIDLVEHIDPVKHAGEDSQHPSGINNGPAPAIIPDSETDIQQPVQDAAEPGLATPGACQSEKAEMAPLPDKMTPLSDKMYYATPGNFQTITIGSPKPAETGEAMPLKATHKIKVWGPF